MSVLYTDICIIFGKLYTNASIVSAKIIKFDLLFSKTPLRQYLDIV